MSWFKQWKNKIYLRHVAGITSHGNASPVEDVAKELFPKNLEKLLVGIN